MIPEELDYLTAQLVEIGESTVVSFEFFRGVFQFAEWDLGYLAFVFLVSRYAVSAILFRYGVLCAGDTPPEPLADETAPQTEAEPPAEEDREPPRARLDRWLETVRPESFTEDEVLRKTLAGAEGILYRYRAGCVELAVPEAAHAHIAPALLFTRAEKLRGGNYFVLKLSAQGLPCRADEPSTY